MTCFQYDKRSIQGKRKSQEDYSDFAFITENKNIQAHNIVVCDKVLAVLADGMGGHVGGACASQTACKKFIEAYTNGSDCKTEDLLLTTALSTSNQALSQKIEADKSLSGMGCTFIAAVIEEDNLHWVSVGDSVLFLHNGEALSQLNENHSYSAHLDKMVALGEMSEKEAEEHPNRHALTSALTGKEIDKIDVTKTPYKLKGSDWLILASDGLLSVPRKKIDKVIKDNKNRGAKAIVDALLQAVKKANHPKQDNTTIMALHSVPLSEEVTVITERIKETKKKPLWEEVREWSIEKVIIACIVVLISLTFFSASFFVLNRLYTVAEEPEKRKNPAKDKKEDLYEPEYPTYLEQETNNKEEQVQDHAKEK